MVAGGNWMAIRRSAPPQSWGPDNRTGGPEKPSAPRSYPYPVPFCEPRQPYRLLSPFVPPAFCGACRNPSLALREPSFSTAQSGVHAGKLVAYKASRPIAWL